MAGRAVAGPWVRAACARHLDDLTRDDVSFDPAMADHAIGFFPEFLRLAEGEHAGKPFTLQPWQQFIVGSLFGWQAANGYRRFRVGYVEAGKGCGKTPMLAGILLYGMLLDDEPGAECYCAAVTRDQARIMFEDARKMAEASTLAPRLDINAWNIADRSSSSFLRPVSSEGRSLDGKRVHMAGIDEIHEHPTAIVVEKMRAGTKGRRQALIVEITNSGYDRTSVCWQHHEYSISVVRRVVQNDAWFGYVCALDEGDRPLESEASWPKSMPNLDVSVTRLYVREQVTEALGMPAKEAIVRRLNFCEWTQQRTRFLPIDRWLAITERVEDAELRGMPCWGGLDLGQSQDFSCGVLIWRLPDGRVPVRMKAWIPEATMRARPDRPWEAWQAAGALTIVEGETTDYDFVELAFSTWARAAGARDIGYDKRFAEQMAQHLTGDGLDMVDTGQGFQLNEALRVMLDLVTTGKLIHEGNPVLTWMADNLVVRHGSREEVRPDKPSARDKIDGIVALAMALDRMIRTPSPQSVYDLRVRDGESPMMIL